MFKILFVFFVALVCVYSQLAVPGDREAECNAYNNNCLSCIQEVGAKKVHECEFCSVDRELEFLLTVHIFSKFIFLFC